MAAESQARASSCWRTHRYEEVLAIDGKISGDRKGQRVGADDVLNHAVRQWERLGISAPK